MDYPPNSRKSAEASREPKRVEPVVSAGVTRRKKSLGKQFQNTFFNGSARMAAHYVVFSVLIPAAKDALAEAGSQGIEKLIYGEGRRKGGFRPSSGPLGYINYNQAYQQGPPRPTPGPQRGISQRARQLHDFDEILIPSRQEAEDVLERMYDILSRYEMVTVADLYRLTGLASNHTDEKWGWLDLRGSNIRRVRSTGYLLDLPEPEYLD